MKLVYLIGIPGTGKSTVMKKVMEKIVDNRKPEWVPDRPIDLLDTHVLKGERIRVLGKYEEGETFSGTDRLSMAVAPKAIEWVQTNPNEVVFGEGDRLNNKAFFESCKPNLHIIHLTVSDEERQRRYAERGSEQPEKFIQTCRTKCKNILDQFGDQQTLFGFEKGYVTEFVHETPEDTDRIVSYMLELVD